MLAGIWTVTGWHRHVGTVADYYSDPDLAAFSWKQGEAYPRPKQHLILSVVAAFTAMAQPKLSEDYTHVFAGMEDEFIMTVLWRRFQEELKEVHGIVHTR